MAESPGLPREVVAALSEGRRLDAISLLQSSRKIGLAEAKRLIDAQCASSPARGNPSVVKAALVVAAVGWALASSVDAAGSLLVILRRAGYRRADFTVARLSERRSRVRGDQPYHWELQGAVDGARERLSDPALIGKRHQRRGQGREVARRFPPGAVIEVLYNPDATGTLFQGRALRVIPYVEDVLADQSARVGRWLIFGLSPLLMVWFALARPRAKAGSRRTAKA